MKDYKTIKLNIIFLNNGSILAPSIHVDESIGLQMKWFQSHTQLFQFRILFNNLLKLKAFRAPVSKSLRIPMVPPYKSILA
jgi:hypothetical protein